MARDREQAIEAAKAVVLSVPKIQQGDVMYSTGIPLERIVELNPKDER